MSSITTLEIVDNVMQMAIKEDNPDIVFDQLKRLEDAEKFVGMAKAKFICSLNSVWDTFSLSKEQTLAEAAYEHLGWRAYTIRRYIDMWTYKDIIPDSFGLDDRPVREITPITNALSQGIEFSDDDWDNLSRTTKQEEVYAVVREIRGKEPRQGSLQVYLYDDGSVVAWHKNERHEIGFLDINNKDDAVQKAINRMISGGGIILG